jgi:hypothetical protein
MVNRGRPFIHPLIKNILFLYRNISIQSPSAALTSWFAKTSACILTSRPTPAWTSAEIACSPREAIFIHVLLLQNSNPAPRNG